jgi:DNA invertase Pin-like site-specific DNA recombinase
MSEKIFPRHTERKAMLYVRQSSPYQVVHNEESRRLQYAMRQRLEQLGFSQVEVIDEDLGRSAAGGVTRTGFEQMVAEVCLGKVGAVAAREVSRFARNSREWQQLVEVCRVVDTLLIDQEMVYDPRRGNDRLLLGLKGTLNEYELELLRLRSWEARQAKARRGELLITPPVGFIKTPDDRLEMDPDRRVQEALRLVFAKFLELGTVRQVLMWFLDQGLSLPTRHHVGTGWETVWRRPAYPMVHRVLTNPEYAGAYAYGKTQTGSHFHDGTTRKTTRRRPTDQWLALIPEHHEGYIAWDQFQRIQAMIAGNVLRTDLENPGAARRGAALLTGLLRCRRCGRKLTVTYTGRRREVLRYACHRGHLDIGEPKCISFGGTSVDEAVGREVLRVVQPGAVEAALLAGQEQCQQQSQVLDALELDLKAARYAAQRAWKQYDAVDPENRLVADELEKRWNAAMDRVRALEHRMQEEQACQQQVTPPTPEVFQNLAADLLGVWEHPATDVRLKKRIIRTLIHEVIVDLDSAAGQVALVIHWQGGVHTELNLPRRRRGQNSTHTDIRIVEAVRLMAKVCTDDLIANVLNRNGLLTGHKNRWSRQHVISLRSHHEIPIHSPARQEAEGWMNLTEAAALVGVSPKTLRLAAERGQIPFDHPLSDGPWIFNRRNLQGPMIDKLVQQARRKCAASAGRTPGQLCLDLTSTWRGEAV